MLSDIDKLKFILTTASNTKSECSLSIKEIVKSVRKLARKHPKVWYDKGKESYCCYSRGLCSNNSVGCIFGQVLSSYGIDVVSIDNRGAEDIDALLSELGINWEDVDQDWFREVQEHQDNGMTWGESIELADKYINDKNQTKKKKT